MYHVDLLRSLDRLNMPDSEVTFNHAMNLDFLENKLHVLVAKIFSLEYLACVNWLSWIYCRANDLLTTRGSPILLREQVSCKLSLTNFSKAALTNDFVIKDYISVHLAHFRCSL